MLSKVGHRIINKTLSSSPLENEVDVSDCEYTTQNETDQTRSLHNLEREKHQLENETYYPAKMVKQIEKIQFSFHLKDKQLFASDRLETCQLFFKLIALGLSEMVVPMKLLNRYFSISNVLEVKKSDSTKGWCENEDEKLLLFQNNSNIRILSSELSEYHVYVFSDMADFGSGRFYGVGFFYINVLYTHYAHSPEGEKKTKNVLDTERESTFFSKYNFTDVTSLVLESNDSTTETSFMVVVCDKEPKIRVKCKDHTMIRVKICELEYKNVDRSFCFLKT